VLDAVLSVCGAQTTEFAGYVLDQVTSSLLVSVARVVLYPRAASTSTPVARVPGGEPPCIRPDGRSYLVADDTFRFDNSSRRKTRDFFFNDLFTF